MRSLHGSRENVLRYSFPLTPNPRRPPFSAQPHDAAVSMFYEVLNITVDFEFAYSFNQKHFLTSLIR